MPSVFKEQIGHFKQLLDVFGISSNLRGGFWNLPFFFPPNERYNRIALSLARFGLSHVTKDVWMEETTSFIVSCRGV